MIETHEYSGYGILSIIVLFMFINLLKFFIEVYHVIKTKIPIIYEHWRLKRLRQKYGIDENGNFSNLHSQTGGTTIMRGPYKLSHNFG